MIPKSLSDMLTALAPALGDHLWQSTVFALACAALNVFLRKNHARARYGLWLAASLKFLVPFSVLVSIGSHLAWTRTAAPRTGAGLYFAIEEASRPFTQTMAAAPAISQNDHSTILPRLILSLILILPWPFLLAALWLCGFVAVLALWYVRWQQISATMRDAARLEQGREVETLRRIERIAGLRRPTEMLLSRSSLAPGIVGIVHPTLLWPEGISEHLENAHLEAILAHEVWHVRRRDNLMSAVHMLVEALFWFHPLVWWLGARLVDERERACDEAVLELGSERRVYAESILKTCEFSLGSPLPCISGVAGADLRHRIVHIMTRPVVRKLGLRNKILLSVATIVAIATPIVFGLVSGMPQSATPDKADAANRTFSYEVASIKPEKSGTMMFRVFNTPDGFTATTTLLALIRVAYGIEDNQISGAPGWVNSDRYNVEAKMDQATADTIRKLGEAQIEPVRQHMLQELLAERFKLAIHRETKELPIYSLVVAKGGPKLQEAKPGDTYPNGIKGPDGRPMRPGSHMMRMGRGELTAQSIVMAQMAHLLTQQTGRTVVDNTGLKGNYDFTLHWTPDQSSPMFNGPGGGPGPDSSTSSESGPSIFTAVQEQLGLKLESQKGPVEILVIDHVEKPSEN
jgi:bla regulator protein blaR1